MAASSVMSTLMNPTRTMQKIVEEQGPGVARIQATHCMDMIAGEAERELIAKEMAGGEKVWWMTPGWIQVNRQNDDYPMREEAAIKQQLDELKFRVTQLHDDTACLKLCSRLNDLLQKIYETRVGLNQLEQDLLQTHLKCCISPNIKIPGEVVLAL